MKWLLSPVWLLPAILSCSQKPKQEIKYVSPAVTAGKLLHGKYSVKDVDNRIDPSCMMPLSAGIGDTLHYLGLVLGFCSLECKKDFFKDPKGNLRLAQLKKSKNP